MHLVPGFGKEGFEKYPNQNHGGSELKRLLAEAELDKAALKELMEVNWRRAVDHLKDRRVSERRACRLTGFSRSAAWYPLKGRDDGKLRTRLKQQAERYPRYGYPSLHDLLKAEGLVINPKRTYRIYRDEGLQVRT